MRLKVNENTITALLNVRGDWLLKDGNAEIMIVREVQYIHEKPEPEPEEQPVLPPNTNIFKRKRDKKREEVLEAYYITKLKVEGYHGDGKFIGTYNEEWCERLARMQDDKYNSFSVYKLRTDWEKFEEQMNAFKHHEEELAKEKLNVKEEKES